MEVVVTDRIHCIAYKHRLVLIKTENIKTMSMEGDSTVVIGKKKTIVGTWTQGKQKTKYNYIMKCWDICKYLRINFLNQLSFKTKYGAI